jgi:Bacterial Ig domain
VNSGPRARDVTRSTTLDAPVNVALTGHDADGDPLTFAPSAPSRGMIGAAGPVACSGTACTAGVTYTPPLGLCNGAASFSYAVSDGGLSDAATASITISTPRKPTTITLSQSLGVVSYLKSVKLTAHLGHISPGARISIFQTPYGSTRRRVASGTPSVKGNLVASVRMLRRSTFQAVGTSGNCYAWDRRPSGRATRAPPVQADGRYWVFVELGRSVDLPPSYYVVPEQWIKKDIRRCPRCIPSPARRDPAAFATVSSPRDQAFAYGEVAPGPGLGEG